MRTSIQPTGRRRPARLAWALVAAAAVMLTAAAPALAADTWPQFGQDPGHLGVSGFDTPLPPYERAWKFAMPGRDRSLSAPVISGDTAIALSASAVYGVDLANGEERWRVPRDGGQVFATPAVADVDGVPVLLFTQGDKADESSLLAYSLEDPEAPAKLWEVPLRDVTTSGVSVEGTTAFTGDLSGNVYAVDVVNEVRGVDENRDLVTWEHAVDGVLRAPPAIGGGKVVVTAINQTTRRVQIVALVEATGEEEWSLAASATSTQATPATIAGDRVLVGFGEPSGGGVLTAFSLGDGLTLWSTRFSSQFFVLTDILVSDGYALAFAAHIGLEAGMYHVRLSDGARSTPWNYGADQLWSYEFDTSGVLSSPVAIGNTVVLGLDDGRMAAIDTASGLLVWKADVGDAPIRGLAAGDGVLIASVGSREGGLVAFRNDPDGEPLAEVSSSKPNWGVMLGNYAIAFAGVGVAAGVIGLLARRRGWASGARRPDDDPDEPDDDDEAPDGEEPS